MHKIFLFSLALVLMTAAGCAPTYVENIVTSQGSVLELNGARLEIPANSVTDTVRVRVEKRGVARHKYAQGFSLNGVSYVILPETLVFEEPAVFFCPAEDENTGMGARIGKGFVPLPGAEVRSETLRAPIWHGGEYYLTEEPGQYGIVDHVKTDEGLLIVGDFYISNYLSNLKKVLQQKGYGLPVWIFAYRPDVSVEDNARMLHEDLKTLHQEYGDFRLDVVSFGVGGLVTHRYLTDSAYYMRDISSAVIAVGTPFFGSNFAIIDNAKQGSSPFRFALIDAMAEHVQDLVPGSELISSVQGKKHLPGFHYYDDPTENKNFVSLRGQKVMAGSFPEEIAGDGLVPLRSAMLTAIEPASFNLDHFALFESKDVHDVVADFVMLYRTFSWPMLFSSVWNDRKPYSVVNATWEKETRLHFRDETDFDALLEFNKNLLNSAPANAVLITNGDYDTYPSWLLQEEGIRTDVLIVNRSLLNLKDYARFLKRHGLPLLLTEQEIAELKHIKEDGGFWKISDQLIEKLLEQSSRPVVFSTTVYGPEQYGYPLKLAGLVYEVSESDIDIVRTKYLLYEVFEFDKLFSRSLGLFDRNIQSMVRNYAAVAYNLSGALDASGEYEAAITALEFAKRFGEEPMFYYNEAQIYFKMGERSAADSALERLLEIEAGDVKLEKEVARIYHENGMDEKAVSILAGILEKQPTDKEIITLIRKYQGE
ncbi:MAG: tetratricopeptide repeat protein [candidate division WOR-3 bacterium]|jgi:tetratricopeptide (TPR) repeat protein